MIHSSQEKEFIFIHNPKVAGSSINKWLSEICEDYDPKGFSYIYEDEHIDLAATHHFKIVIPYEKWEKYFKFAFVRNPYDKMISGWKYFQKLEGLDYSFQEFIEKLDQLRCYPSVVWHSIISQSTHLPKGEEIFIYKYENLQNTLELFARAFKLAFKEIPRVNTTDHNNYQSYYDEDLANMVYDRFEEDFINFNYHKDSWKIDFKEN